jgi:hypothetical protein
MPASSADRAGNSQGRKGGWKAPQDVATRAKALRDGAPAPPPLLERCWECFPDLPPAGSFDWLGRNSPGERDRPGQPLKRFLQPGPHRNFPTRMSRRIYLLPLGNVTGAPDQAVLRRLLTVWFGLETVMMPTLPAKALATLERDEAGSGYGPQIESPSAAQIMHAQSTLCTGPKLVDTVSDPSNVPTGWCAGLAGRSLRPSVAEPKDAFALIGYTMEDICDTRKGFDFLFGQAHLDLSVGLFSFARYSDDVDMASARFLRRCGMVLCHEAMHLFGIKHCVYACCLMNGSNHLAESEARPFAVCPVDLQKLALTLDQAKLQGRDTPPVDIVARERSLHEFFHEHGLEDDAQFSRMLITALTGVPEPALGALK